MLPVILGQVTSQLTALHHRLPHQVHDIPELSPQIFLDISTFCIASLHIGGRFLGLLAGMGLPTLWESVRDQKGGLILCAEDKSVQNDDNVTPLLYSSSYFLRPMPFNMRGLMQHRLIPRQILQADCV